MNIGLRSCKHCGKISTAPDFSRVGGSTPSTRLTGAVFECHKANPPPPLPPPPPTETQKQEKPLCCRLNVNCTKATTWTKIPLNPLLGKYKSYPPTNFVTCWKNPAMFRIIYFTANVFTALPWGWCVPFSRNQHESNGPNCMSLFTSQHDLPTNMCDVHDEYCTDLFSIFFIVFRYGNRSKLVTEARRKKSRAPSPGTASGTAAQGEGGGKKNTKKSKQRPLKRQRVTKSSSSSSSNSSATSTTATAHDESDSNKTSACAKACAALQLSAVPKSLPCREQEREEIMQFVRGGIQHGGLGCALYIAGMPGTGKTATVKEVIHTLMQEAEEQQLPPFKHIEINAMKLQRPHETYSLLWRAVSGQHASDHRAALLLDHYFQTPSSKRVVHVVLVDELDYMVSLQPHTLKTVPKT